jgi:hypothetical protein
VRLLSLSLLPLALSLAACDGPCESLAKQICSCEQNAVEEAGCLQEVRAAMARISPSVQEEETCSELLDGCTCDKLENEEFEACGLTKGE